MAAETTTDDHSEKILETAEMLFHTQGFDNTTVGDITTRLNISDSLFFLYFESVDEVLEVLWSGPPLSRDRKAKQRKNSTFRGDDMHSERGACCFISAAG